MIINCERIKFYFSYELYYFQKFISIVYKTNTQGKLELGPFSCVNFCS